MQAALAVGAVMLNGCMGKITGQTQKYKHISGGLGGPDARAGHMLRDKSPLPPATGSQEVDVLVVGAGVSGLSAGRWLQKQGMSNFVILELEDHVGGNAHHQQNRVSRYPLGAHYITIANNDDQELLQFLEESGVITGYQNGLPLYNEFYLCFDPEERLLINGQWQDGLIPRFGVNPGDTLEINKFLNLADQLRDARGSDGKYAFYIPVDQSSDDPAFRKLDTISFADYLKREGYQSPYLLWYLEYCCKDDYGLTLDHISAWAGLNYFSGHKGRAANADQGAVLTWPEGNGWLIRKLREKLDKHIKTSFMTHKISFGTDGKVQALVYDLKTASTVNIIADQVIMATPQFVNNRILEGISRPFDAAKITYAPWMVANITVQDLPSGPPSWDNVPFGKPSVGYVYAGHQQPGMSAGPKVLTFYLPLCKQSPRVARLAAYARTYEQWLDIIIPEMEYMHPGITRLIMRIDVWVWGHGMVSPTTGYIWGEDRRKARQHIGGKVFFGHTDLSGISLFEEGFHQGIRAAKELLATRNA